MGDRTWVHVTTSPAFRKQVDDAFGGINDEIESTDGLPTFILQEVNYPGQGDLSMLAAKGIPFHGYHGEGADYPAMVFASDGQDVCFASSLDGLPACTMNPNGTIAGGWNCADLYFKALTAAKYQLEVYVKTGTCGWLEKGERRAKVREIENRERCERIAAKIIAPLHQTGTKTGRHPSDGRNSL